jgi:anti-sigma B factor antagonist
VDHLDNGNRPGPERLSVTRTDRDDCIMLVVRGDLSLATEGQLLGAAGTVLRERSGRPLVLDLTGVGFAGSLGLSELIMLDHEAATYGQEVRVVVGRNYPLQRAVASAGLEGSFPIFGSMDDALA